MNDKGQHDPLRGIRSFIVGTGGAKHYALQQPVANSEATNSETWGVLKLTLDTDQYAWEFLPVAGQTYRDAGSAPCVKR